MDGKWTGYQLRWLYRKIKKKITKKPTEFSHYAGRDVLTIRQGSDWLRQAVEGGQPFMACRFGNVELNAMEQFEKSNSPGRGRAMERLCLNAGFFPNDEQMGARFARLMKESCGQADLIGVWFNRMEDYMIETYGSQAALTYLRGLEPWYTEQPWTSALAGKRVVVIHPFADTIEKQYRKRELLFPGKDILPAFDLSTVKAVQTIAGERDDRFGSWFEALDWMEEQAAAEDFDIAVIGCGAYGFPLAARLKARGRQAVHLGGATQLLFGIKGARWENHPVISRLFNENWVRPSEEETPGQAGKVEGACYW